MSRTRSTTQTDRPAAALVPVAQNAAKAWIGAQASWAGRPLATPLERAFAAEASLGAGDCDTAARLVEDVALPSAAAPWLAALRQEIAKIAQLQARLPAPHTTQQLGKLLGARLFTAIDDVLAGMPERSASDDLLLADALYRRGDFAGCVAASERLVRREGALGPVELDKAQRLLRNAGTRVGDAPAGRGALSWAFRHPLVASARERAQAGEPTGDDIAFLIDLSRCLGVGDLLREAVSPQGYFVGERLVSLFGRSAFSRVDLGLLLGAVSERSTRENHDVACALIGVNRIEWVPDLYPECPAAPPNTEVDARGPEPDRASIAEGSDLLRILRGDRSPADDRGEARWALWLFSFDVRRDPVRLTVAGAADPAVVVEADLEGTILRACALDASPDGTCLLPRPLTQRLAVLLPAARSASASVGLGLLERAPAPAAIGGGASAARGPAVAVAEHGARAGEPSGTLDRSVAEHRPDGETSGRPSRTRPIEETPDIVIASPALQIRHYRKTKRFDEMARLGDAIGLEGATAPDTLLPLIEAYANVGREDDVRRTISAAVIGLDHARYDVGILLRLYAFETLLPRPVTDNLRAAILAKLDTYDGTPERLLHLAHQAMRHDDRELLDKARSRSRALGGEDSSHQARHDIQEAQLAFRVGDYPGQLRALNRAIARHGLGALDTLDAARPVGTDNLAGRAPRTIEGDLPRVSVVMTMYNRARMLPHAARSILEQSYRELELVLVDDASEDDTLAVAHAITARDPRVRVLALNANAGAYVARNEGLRISEGAFVTCQDSDDYAHPEKLETAVRHLLRDDNPLATTVQHVRCNENEGFKSHVGYIRKDYSSLLFRRGPTLDRVGYFDCCRAGADAEFQIRMRRIAGEDAIADLPHLASIVDAGAGTLTGGGRFAMDDDQGVMSPERNAYRRSFLRWHASTDDLRLDYPQSRRPFEIV